NRSVPAPFRSSSRRIPVHPANLKSSVNVFPRAVRALLLLLSTDVKIFFRTIKEVSCTPGKSCLERKPSGRLKPALGPAGKRRFPSRTGFPRSLIKIPRSISPPRLIPGNPRKTTSQLLPARKAPAGRSVLTIINETVPNLGGLASVPIPTLRHHTCCWQPHDEYPCVFWN